MDRIKPGRTGNTVLADILHAMKEEQIDGTVYSHPVGDHGHAAGPLIGLWDHQEGVPGRGDVPLLSGTWFSIELQATTPIAEWDGRPLEVALEEDMLLNEQGKPRGFCAARPATTSLNKSATKSATQKPDAGATVIQAERSLLYHPASEFLNVVMVPEDDLKSLVIHQKRTNEVAFIPRSVFRYRPFL